MATAKLNQIIAVEKGVKSKSFSELTEAHHLLLKPALLSGISRSYQPKDDEGEQLPPESTKVQVKAEEVLRKTAATLTRLFDVTATKDWANCVAKADITVDGTVLLKDVPVTYLLFLEKQLTDLHTFIKKLPVLDAGESWVQDAVHGQLEDRPGADLPDQAGAAQPREGRGDREAPGAGRGLLRGRDHRLLDHREVLRRAGRPAGQRTAGPVEKLQQAVKFAREEANGTEVADQRVGEAVFGYLFG